MNALLILLQVPQTHESGSNTGLIVVGVAIALIIWIVKSKDSIFKIPEKKTSQSRSTIDSQSESASYCPSCGTKFQEKVRFCSNCGYDIASYEKKNETETNRAKENKPVANLLELKKMLDAGSITQEDYDRKKEEFLARL